MDRRGRVCHQGGTDVSGLVDLAPPRQVGNSEVGGDLGFRARVDPPLHQPVHIPGFDPGVGQRGEDRLQGERQLSPSAVPGVVGLADADDGHRVGERHGCGRSASAGSDDARVASSLLFDVVAHYPP